MTIPTATTPQLPDLDEDRTRPDTVDVQLPNPPQGDPQRSSGRSQRDAEQQADRDITSGSVDAENIAAGLGPLGYDFLRDAEGVVESVAALQESEEAVAAGETLIDRAERGVHLTGTADLVATTRVAIEGHLAEAADLSARTVAAHDTSVGVLDGVRERSDGTRYPGRILAPGTKRISVAIRRAYLIELLPFALPLVIESIVVYSNMRIYLRSDDGDILTPAGIAVSTVALLTMVPFLLGRAIGRVVHGGRFALWQWISVGAAAAAWAGVGVLLAVIRVDIDRAAAIAKAEDQARNQFNSDAEPPVFDPDAVFEARVPLAFWLTVFLGLGVMLILWELLHHNPAQIEELEARQARQSAGAAVIRLESLKAEVARAVALQQKALEHSLAMWRQELDAIAARVARDKQVYRTALRNTSGDPRTALAIELRDESTVAPSEADER